MICSLNNSRDIQDELDTLVDNAGIVEVCRRGHPVHNLNSRYRGHGRIGCVDEGEDQ